MIRPALESEPALAPDPNRTARRALWAAFAVAVVVRLALLASKPFWRDEASVALIIGKPALAVATDRRAVPLGFVALSQIVAAVPGIPPEVGFRLVPLLAGLAVVPLLGRLATALGASTPTAVAAVWLAAGLPPFVYYSRELKSYGLDLLLAVVLPLLACRGFTGAAPSRHARWALVACLALAPWVSFGALFPILAVLSWSLIVWWRHADRAARRDLVLCAGAFAASFSAAYLVALGQQATSPQLHTFWQAHLLAGRDASLLGRVVVGAWTYLDVSLRYPFPVAWPAVLVLAAVGAYTWPRPQRGFLVWLSMGTGAFCVGAALVDRYLLTQGRLLLFAAPPLLLWTANGLVELGRRVLGPVGARVALIIPIAASLWWTKTAISHRVGHYLSDQTLYFRYDVLHDVDAVIGKAANLVLPNEPVLISSYCAYPFQFYARGRLQGATYCERLCPDFNSIMSSWLARMGARGWLILTDEETYGFAPFLDAAGFERRQRAWARGVRLWEITRRGG